MSTISGWDPVGRSVSEALQAIERGERPAEHNGLDFKEDAGRRAPDGSLGPGEPMSERAAVALAPEVACMSNSTGGGALLVGVADDGHVLGTPLDAAWLQMRLYQLLQNKITTVVTPVDVLGERVLVIRCPAAVEPVVWKNKVKWRVGDQCQEIDAASWFERRAHGWGYDWSEQPTALTVADVRASAVEVARSYLRDAGGDRAQDLADAETPDLLRRLRVMTSDGKLTNAGALAFVGRSSPALDYVRRPSPGADREERVNLRERSLLEELGEVFTVARAYNPEAHVERGLAIGQVRALPERALREAIVNGVVHRDWSDPAPTLVEHIGATLRVTSPGGFWGGVRADNIINHPSSSRNALLADLFTTLHIAEREGIGVDRMIGDMLRLGHPLPTIEEQDGLRVVAVLAGERPDIGWMRWLSVIEPDIRDHLGALMALYRLVRQWWVDAEDLAPFLQVTRVEADQVVERLRTLRFEGTTVTFDVEGVPASRQVTVLGLCDPSLDALRRMTSDDDHVLVEPTRETIALRYAQHAGRISTTELASIIGAHATNVGSVLRRLEEEGSLEPSRENRRGAGFFYRHKRS